MLAKTNFIRTAFIAVTIFLFFACDKDSANDSLDDTNIEVTENQNSDCSAAILYNVKDLGKDKSNWKIAIKTGDEEEQILVEDDNYDFWWVRLHPSKEYFICYRSPIGDNKEDNDYSRAELWRFDVDGSNREKLIDLQDYNWMAQGVADWSPDGKHLIMMAQIVEDSSKPNDGYFQIVRTDANGKNPIQVTSGSGLRADPTWSIDDKKIIYTAFSQDYDFDNIVQLLTDIAFQTPLEIHIADIDADGNLSNITQLTNDEIRDNDPYMSPDGKFIAWESFVNGTGAIRTYNMANGKVETILEKGELPCCPSWLDDPNRFLIHSLKLFVSPFYIAEYNLETKIYTPVLKSNNKGYINPQWVYWKN